MCRELFCSLTGYERRHGCHSPAVFYRRIFTFGLQKLREFYCSWEIQLLARVLFSEKDLLGDFAHTFSVRLGLLWVEKIHFSNMLVSYFNVTTRKSAYSLALQANGCAAGMQN